MTFVQYPNALNQLEDHKFLMLPPMSYQQFENFSMICDDFPANWINYQLLSMSKHFSDKFSKINQ